MLFEERTGTIADSDAHTLVCPTNAVGVMGNGMAKWFSLKIPGLLSAYRDACKKGDHGIGKPWLFKASEDRWILCFATKSDWKNPSKLEWIEEGLVYLRDNMEAMGIRSIAFPPIGCGKGGLDWKDVKPLIYRYMDSTPIAAEIWTPPDFESFY